MHTGACVRTRTHVGLLSSRFFGSPPFFRQELARISNSEVCGVYPWSVDSMFSGLVKQVLRRKFVEPASGEGVAGVAGVFLKGP